MDNSEGSQQEHLKETSISGLVQYSETLLENECLVIEKEMEEKSASLKQLKEICAKQAENNIKLSKELERLKVMTKFETINREACQIMHSKQRAKCQTTEKYLNDLCKMINLGIASKEELTTVIRDTLSTQLMSVVDALTKLRLECSEPLSQSDQMLIELEDEKKGTEQEFDEVERHFQDEIHEQKLQLNELQKQEQYLETACKEMGIKINMMMPENEELKQEIINLENGLFSKRESLNSLNDQLQSSLQEELNKKENFLEELKSQDKIIQEMNYVTTTKETEIKTLDRRLKELISQEENLGKTEASELGELNQFQSQVKSLKETFNHLFEVNEENNVLKRKIEELHTMAKDYDKNILDIELVERLRHERITEFSKEVEEMKTKRNNFVNEKYILDDKIKSLLKEIDDEAINHSQLSSEIDSHHSCLIEEQASLTANIDAIEKHILETNNETKQFQSEIEKLNTQLNNVKTEYEETETKISSLLDKLDSISQYMIAEDSILDDMIIKSEQELKKAQSDVKEVDIVKENIKHMESEFESQCQHYGEELKLLQDSHNKSIGEAKQNYDELRLKYDGDLQKKEQIQTDTMMEMKEISVKINEVEQRKQLASSEIARLKRNLVKYDKVTTKLESKLNTAIHVAVAPSQSVMDHSSNQATANQSTSQASKKPQAALFPSQGSTSSGETYVPTKEHILLSRKILAGAFNTKTKTQKKKTNPPPPKEKDDLLDEWGF